MPMLGVASVHSSFTLYSTLPFRTNVVLSVLHSSCLYCATIHKMVSEVGYRMTGGNLLPMLMPSNVTLCQISIFYGCFKSQWKFEEGDQNGITLCLLLCCNAILQNQFQRLNYNEFQLLTNTYVS